MTPFAALLTAIGLLAALVARFGVAAAARRGGVAEHLRRLFTLIALLLALRLANFVWTSAVTAAMMMVVAAWMPLATLRLSEELVRRHAKRPLKFLALGGAIGFSVLAATFGLFWTREAILALAAFQALVLAGVLFHLLTQRRTVSPSERRAPDMLALAFVLALPLLATDFERLFPGLAFRGGAFAALVFMLACSRLVTSAGRPLALLADIALVGGVAGIAALAAHLMESTPAMVQVASASAGASAALLMLIERFARRAPASGTILSQIAKRPHNARAILSGHPLLASAIPLGNEELADLPGGTVEQLAQQRIIAIGTVAAESGLGGAAREILGRYGASHLLRRSQQPLQFLAISGGALEEDALTSELEIVARLLENAK